MRECTKAFANVKAADLGLELQIWQNSRSLKEKIFTTDEICLSKDISD